MPVSDHIRKKLSTLPHKPGVYLHKDRFGTVIYVGKALDLRKRVSQYFHPSRRMGWDLKFNALVEAIHDFDVHTVKSEPEALLLESKLIKEFHPRYNISFRDDKRHLMVKINLNDPIPGFVFARIRKDDGARYFGPFVNSGALRNTLALVQKQFNLRGCRVFTPGEADYKHCLYAHLKHCTAPCIGNVTLDQYRDQVRAACDFLDGQCHEMRDQLETEMRKAATARDYEKAAGLRDMIQDLERTTKRTEKFARIPYSLPLSINPENDLAALATILDLPAPPQRIEGFDISNISGTFAVASLVSFKNGRPDRANYRRFKIKSVEGQDDFASMAEVIRRRYTRVLNETRVQSPESKVEIRDEGDRAIVDELRTLVKETSKAFKSKPRVQNQKSKVTAPSVIPQSPSSFPDLILIDGGKGQLNAACAELAKLGLKQIPVIGLAKEFEEIHRPGESKPLRLGLDHPAVKLLQRVRDESHRVANSYNAQLRIKKISESILDDFPGIGEQRKAALLKKFGSVQRLRTATLEQIARVTGFGGKAAAELKSFLDARSNTATGSTASSTAPAQDA
ncbi:MAG: excinuclease ABC subunit UvrC [Verrucomicrobia bacterium]|nr:excinuclease ABC subunit UvrC [Verrucomicrobiota bacterium]